MANGEHVDRLRESVAGWNKWIKKHPYPETVPDFSGERKQLQGLDLSKADLRRAYLRDANLDKAVLRGANLWKADLGRAKLRHADLRAANLRKANLFEAKLNDADLSGANLTGTLFVDTRLKRANLSGCFVHGCSVWDVKMQGANQRDLVILEEAHKEEAYGEGFWDARSVAGARITVDDLEVAQFIYLLLNREKLRNVVDAVTARGVLILGRFGGGGLEVLQSVAAALRDESFLPIIFDFERPTDRNYTETVKTLVGLSRFVIVDLSGPSVPHELYATVPHFKVPFVPILEGGRESYSMFADILEYPWVEPIVHFDCIEDLRKRIRTEIIAPAEKRHEARQERLNQLFPQ